MALAHRTFRGLTSQAMPALSMVHALHFSAPEPTCTEGTAVCPFCSVGCRLNVTVEHNRVASIAALADSEHGTGRMCSRADALAVDPTRQWNRLKHPMMRRHRGEHLGRVSWDQALTFAADEIQRVQINKGRGAIGWIGSGKLDTESAYLFSKLFKGFLRTNNTDGGAPSGHETASRLLTSALGAAGSTACFDDLSSADVTLILGCDVAQSHPVLFDMIRERRTTAANSRVIVIGASATQAGRFADVDVQLNPGSEAAFIQLVAKRLLAIGRADDRFIRRSAQGFTDYRVQLESLDEGALLRLCGVHPARVDEVVDFLSTDARLLTLFDLDSTSPMTGDALSAAIDLHLQLGEIGRGGAGLLGLSVHANAMGALESGATPGGLPGDRRVGSEDERERMEVKWGVPAGSIQPEPGFTGRMMLEAAARGELTALWIAGGLEAIESADGDLVRRALAACELVIVQDAIGDSDAAAMADVLLPTTLPLESTGTRTSSERRVERSTRLLDAPGEAKPNWWIAARTAVLMGFEGFEYADAEAIWDEFHKLTAGSDCDMAGITNARLSNRPLHWPCPDDRHVGTIRRFMSGRFATESGRASFLPLR